MYLLSTEDGLKFIERFNNLELPKTEWTHEAHLMVGLWVTTTFSERALPEMRQRIRRFNESVGTINSDSTGYHETLTVFWLWAIRQFCERINRWTFDEIALDELLFDENLTRRRLVEDYYTEGVLLLPEARKKFIRPDVQPLRGVDFLLIKN